MPKITLNLLQSYKDKKEKFTCLTAYDASFAKLLSESGIDVLLVGDTLGNVIQGHETTIPVSLSDIIYHTRCVARGNSNALIMADLPFMTYARPDQALTNAAQLMQAGAEIIKMEGGQWLAETIALLHERGIPVCAHLGLLPQSVHKFGGYRIQGKNPQQAQSILQDALILQEAGARLLVLECIPSHLAKEITEKVTIPTIGIGAGPSCDAQVLVLYDILGISMNLIPSFAKNFMKISDTHNIRAVIQSFIKSVKEIQL